MLEVVKILNDRMIVWIITVNLLLMRMIFTTTLRSSGSTSSWVRLNSLSLSFLFITAKFSLLNFLLLKTQIEGHHPYLIEYKVILVHLLDAVDEIIYAGEVLPYLNRLGRLLFLFSLCRIILFLFFLTFFLLLLRFFGLAWVNTLEGGLLFLLFLDLFEGCSTLFFFGLLWESVSRLDFVLDISEANKHGADVFNDARLQADALLLKKLAEVLDVNTFLVALLTILINKDALDGLQVVS